MSFDDLQTGCIVRYPYLWVREARRGETEGRKDRPVAVGVRLARQQGRDVLLLFPITTQVPDTTCFAIEIPDAEKQRVGLDRNLRLWIILDEYNQDVIGESFYLVPTPPLGRFGKAFFLSVLKAFLSRHPGTRRVNRRD